MRKSVASDNTDWEGYQIDVPLSREVICKECEKWFSKPLLSQTKYCSVECRGQSARRRAFKISNPRPPASAVKKRAIYISTASIGAIGELRVCADLLDKGYEVFRSVSPSASCDLIIRRDGILKRIEVRTARRTGSGKLYFPKGNDSNSDHYAAVLPDEIVYIPEI